MEIKNRLFTYPVLCDETDDYNNCKYSAICKARNDVSSLKLSFKIDLDCDSIEKLIRQDKAEFLIHLECSNTSYRKALKFQTFEKDYTIPLNKINGELSVLAIVVAKNKIDTFSHSDLNEDYNDDVVSFNKGAILAYYNLPKVIIAKNYEELVESDSIFHIVQNLSEDDNDSSPVMFDFSGERINILVDSATYESYLSFQQSKNIALSLLVFPAVVQMVEILDGNYDAYQNKMWLSRFEGFCKQNGKDFRYDYIESDMTSVEIAQEFLRYPIKKAYEELVWLGK